MSEQKAKPKTAAEWAEYWKEYPVKDRELTEKMRQAGKTYIDLSDLEFKNNLADSSQENLKALKASMLGELNFYKKILQEAYYTDKPEKKETYRYKEALRKYRSINSKGKIINSLIQSECKSSKLSIEFISFNLSIYFLDNF